MYIKSCASAELTCFAGIVTKVNIPAGVDFTGETAIYIHKSPFYKLRDIIVMLLNLILLFPMQLVMIHLYYFVFVLKSHLLDWTQH